MQSWRGLSCPVFCAPLTWQCFCLWAFTLLIHQKKGLEERITNTAPIRSDHFGVRVCCSTEVIGLHELRVNCICSRLWLATLCPHMTRLPVHSSEKHTAAVDRPTLLQRWRRLSWERWWLLSRQRWRRFLQRWCTRLKNAFRASAHALTHQLNVELFSHAGCAMV